MKTNKYIQCFSKEQSNELESIGYEFLYEQNGTFYFLDNPDLSKFKKFSDGSNLCDGNIKFTKSLNF